MCTAMAGATPVKRCTWAASCAFSHGVRGTPGWLNTLNRVPEFPNAQEGSSIWCVRSASLTPSRSAITEPFSGWERCGVRRQRSRRDLGERGAQQVAGGTEFRQQVTGAQGPVVGDAGRAPVVGPLAGVAAEIYPGRGVADREQRSVHHPAGRGDESERAVALLRDAEHGDRSVLHVELDRDAPAAFAVVDAEPAEQRLALADGQVRRNVVAHLDHPAVVVGNGVAGELGEQAVQADGNPDGPGEIFLPYRPDDTEDLPGQRHPL